MKPPAFEYYRAESTEHALALLAEHGCEAKILAGGQSLVPMLNFRLIQPGVLVDVHKLVELSGIELERGMLRVGALCRHQAFETSSAVARYLPWMRAAVREIGHLAIRNRGTFGGSLAHNDPAAEWPLLCVLQDAKMVTRSAGAGDRESSAEEFFAGYLGTTLEETELLTEIQIPVSEEPVGWGFEELSRRRGDFALVLASSLLRVKRGVISEARLAVGGVAACAMRVPEAEALLEGECFSKELGFEVGDAVRKAVDPVSDLHASADYRREAVGVLARRVAAAAWDRAVEEAGVSG